MYFEIFKYGNLIKRGDEILNSISFTVELMDTPSTSLTIPVYYLDYISGREEIKIFANDKVFWGIITDIDVNKVDETINLSIDHIVKEWEYRQISVNNAIKDKAINIIYKGSESAEGNGETITANPFNMYVKEVSKMSDSQIIARAGAFAWQTATGNKVSVVSADTSKLKKETGEYDVKFSTKKGTSVTVKATVQSDPNDESETIYPETTEPSVIDDISDIYADTNFAYPGWKMNYEDSAGETMIDYVYSRQNKLDALTKTCELTPSLFWRVDFSGEKRIDIGEFGEKKPYIISTKPRGNHNISIVEEPKIDYDFDNVINLATVYSEKSDSGMSSMTLREVYNNLSKQIDGFPVVILRANVNNERNYKMYVTQYPKLAPNNELEYAVLDEESIALEGGTVIEGTYAFNDLGSFNTDSKVVKDEDRVKAAVTAYHSTIRKLKQARRSYKIEIVTEEITTNIKVGDKVRFLYDNSIYNLDACSNYWRKVLTLDDWFYITRIDYDIDTAGVETDTITLEKYLKIDRETENT